MWNYNWTPTKREDEVAHDAPAPSVLEDVQARVVRIDTRLFHLLEHLGVDPHTGDKKS